MIESPDVTGTEVAETDYEWQRTYLLHEMRTVRAKARLGHQVVGERRTLIKTMALLRKGRGS
jgi:hypothetical protein